MWPVDGTQEHQQTSLGNSFEVSSIRSILHYNIICTMVLPLSVLCHELSKISLHSWLALFQEIAVVIDSLTISKHVIWPFPTMRS